MTAINTRLVSGSGGTIQGTEIIAKIYRIDQTGNFVWEGESAPLTVANSDINKNLVIPCDPPLDLIAGTTYLAVVGTTGDNAGLKIANGGKSEIFTSFIKDFSDGKWYYQTNTPYVRMNFDQTVSVQEAFNNNTISQVFPNPVTDMASFSYSIEKSTSLKISVVDVTGKVIYAIDKGTLESGSHLETIDASAFKSGVYFVKIAGENMVSTRKFIKK